MKWSNETLNKALSHTLINEPKLVIENDWIFNQTKKCDYMHLIREPKQNQRNQT